jgi:hypothetical protein
MLCNRPVNSVSGDRVYRGNQTLRTQCVQTAAVFEATWSAHTQLWFGVLRKYGVEFLKFGCGAVEVLGYHSPSLADWYLTFRFVFKGSDVLGRFDPVTCGIPSPRLLRLLSGERL